uniref:ATP synthase F0 subunit 8 n=1 Tax=Erotylinae sp. 2 ACP-2013 TaxID=1434613 RepID=A0A3G5FP14_9CUCU|nr:ATP synthase F0 subunit 8 [Erotylinae sp. 2 ACP-2013]
MSPLNWVSLFIYFIMIFMMVNTMVYFSFLYKPKNKKMKINSSYKIYWKW